MLRPAKREELPQLVAIYNAAIATRACTADTEPQSVESRISWFEGHKDKRPLWVCEQEGRVAGYLSLSDFRSRPGYAGTAEVSLYLSPAFHRRGLGRAMLAEGLERAPKLGVDTLLAIILGTNAPSLALFEGQGFARWGLLPGAVTLEGQPRDVALLGRKLGG